MLKTPSRCLRTTEKASGTVPRPSPAAPKTAQDAFKATLVAALRVCKPLFSALFFQKNPRVRPSRKKEVGLIDFRAEKMGRTRNFWPKKESPRRLSPDFYQTFPGLFPMFHHISWIRLRQKIFPTIFWDNFFFVEKFGSTGHRDPKQKPSEPHQARLPNCVFFQRWMPSHEKLVRPSAPDKSFGKGQAASNSIPQRPNGLCTCSWLPCVTV